MILVSLILLFIFGLFIGSFLGVLVDRLPRGENVIKGRSYCESCKKELGVLDLIPLFSFLFLKGKCRFCKTKLSLFYPVIEVSTGFLFALTLYFISSISLVVLFYYLFIISSFIVIFFTDLKYGIIPDKILFTTIIITFFWLVVNHQQLFIVNVLSGLGAFAFFVAISYIFYTLTKKEGMGGGDIKLALFLGLVLGFPNIIVCLYLAFLTGALVSIILIAWKKKSFQKDALPFGPFMVFGATISLFWGNQIYSYFLRILGI